MGLEQRYNALDEIDISPYLIYGTIERVMYEIEKDYEGIFQSITKNEFRSYIKIRYYI